MFGEFGRCNTIHIPFAYYLKLKTFKLELDTWKNAN